MATIQSINSKDFSYSNIEILIAGQSIVKVGAVSYVVTQEKPNNYGLGKYPTGFGDGVLEYEVSMDIAIADVVRLRAFSLSADRSLLGVPEFTTIVRLNNGVFSFADVMTFCRFTSDGMEASQGDTNIMRSYDIQTSSIVFGRRS